MCNMSLCHYAALINSFFLFVITSESQVMRLYRLCSFHRAKHFSTQKSVHLTKCQGHLHEFVQIWSTYTASFCDSRKCNWGKYDINSKTMQLESLTNACMFCFAYHHWFNVYLFLLCVRDLSWSTSTWTQVSLWIFFFLPFDFWEVEMAWGREIVKRSGVK